MIPGEKSLAWKNLDVTFFIAVLKYIRDRGEERASEGSFLYQR